MLFQSQYFLSSFKMKPILLIAVLICAIKLGECTGDTTGQCKTNEEKRLDKKCGECTCDYPYGKPCDDEPMMDCFCIPGCVRAPDDSCMPIDRCTNSSVVSTTPTTDSSEGSSGENSKDSHESSKSGSKGSGESSKGGSKGSGESSKGGSKGSGESSKGGSKGSGESSKGGSKGSGESSKGGSKDSSEDSSGESSEDISEDCSKCNKTCPPCKECPKCPMMCDKPNEEWGEKRGCEICTCEYPRGQPCHPDDKPKPGCYCKEGYMKQDGQCKPQGSCTKKCGENEIFGEIKPCNNCEMHATCESKDFPYPHWGCTCKTDYCRESKDPKAKCIPIKTCVH